MSVLVKYVRGIGNIRHSHPRRLLRVHHILLHLPHMPLLPDHHLHPRIVPLVYDVNFHLRLYNRLRTILSFFTFALIIFNYSSGRALWRCNSRWHVEMVGFRLESIGSK